MFNVSKREYFSVLNVFIVCIRNTARSKSIPLLCTHVDSYKFSTVNPRVDIIVEVAVNKSLSIHLRTIDVYDMSSKKKLASLLKKYFSIPPEYLAYYHAVPIGFTEQSDLVSPNPTRSKKSTD
jgi:hypothetical protein